MSWKIGIRLALTFGRNRMAVVSSPLPYNTELSSKVQLWLPRLGRHVQAVRKWYRKFFVSCKVFGMASSSLRISTSTMGDLEKMPTRSLGPFTPSTRLRLVTHRHFNLALTRHWRITRSSLTHSDPFTRSTQAFQKVQPLQLVDTQR